ncbi:7,8-didemethyl-8-hydroxy-5-deazariboflavin synthase [Sphingobium lactosutens]|uniref:5-amino-6-(D-ribitylamino)uracil--L-tyrosine 4-hydroxyphenyl transferase CofH n=1 Tax=Sphingobium lactosutens TaxID=522773 RepID=UPI0015BE0C26|nr:5-amino-6-(D-ribitylamino)uracil--L-tyrosine 4-hydroxyphenyl transferase CofH [Sphingobium lactosutens]NWK97397.1 7,8-didemethyl-8-hydroxy-5-deazariboflavin synthase [Sphingobium lactosutens]
MVDTDAQVDRSLAEWLLEAELQELMREASASRDSVFGEQISFSRKVFIPLTHLCRDSCHYCTFASPPRHGEASYLNLEAVREIARIGVETGCTEALFTLGDKPERRYRVAREELAALGHETTLSYLREASDIVMREFGLLPHLNPGLMNEAELNLLRPVSASMGIMLESAAQHLCERGGPHFGSPDKAPELRLEMIERAGRAHIPLTSGLLIGIGESRAERIEALLALRTLHAKHGHLQEIIIQNFRAKPGTRMASAPEPDLEDHLWTIAAARLIFSLDVSVQAPPNLAAGSLRHLIDAGINDWGGVSPVTPDYVNPEAPWPQINALAKETAMAGKILIPRLPVYPSYLKQLDKWAAPAVASHILRRAGADGFARSDAWAPGTATAIPVAKSPAKGGYRVGDIVARLERGDECSEQDIATLFGARGDDLELVCNAADRLRAKVNGNVVSYVVTRNINYTNICSFKCEFCAFSKGRGPTSLRGPAYRLSTEEVARRVAEAWSRGATEVCMQGGIHPEYTGQTYLDLCEVVKDVAPDIHLHAFSPLEIWQGANSLGITVGRFLERLKEAGLGSLPGTAAEILDDEVRSRICPDKISTAEWIGVVETAHKVGLNTTSTMMFGHVDRPEHWARHLLALRALQGRTGGITEFVPLPFVHMEAPFFLKGMARPGPDWRETLLVHSVARLVLHPLIPNIQLSWVKLGIEGARAALGAGVNDLGGTLMNESISRAAGASHGQEMTPQAMAALIEGQGRKARQRTTLYGVVPAEREHAARSAAPLLELS